MDTSFGWKYRDQCYTKHTKREIGNGCKDSAFSFRNALYSPDKTGFMPAPKMPPLECNLWEIFHYCLYCLDQHQADWVKQPFKSIFNLSNKQISCELFIKNIQVGTGYSENSFLHSSRVFWVLEILLSPFFLFGFFNCFLKKIVWYDIAELKGICFFVSSIRDKNQIGLRNIVLGQRHA